MSDFKDLPEKQGVGSNVIPIQAAKAALLVRGHNLECRRCSSQVDMAVEIDRTQEAVLNVWCTNCEVLLAKIRIQDGCLHVAGQFWP